MINLTIDGRTVEVDPGVTLMEAARREGICIPGLCSHPDIPPAGICGLCAVEVEGREDLVQACEIRAEPGMKVYTGTPRVKELRRDKLAAIIGSHPHSCLTCAQQEGCSRTQCSSNVPEKERCCPNLGKCELQKVAVYVGIKPDTARYKPLDCDLRLLISEPPAPPDSWMEFNEDNICLVPESEGVYQLLDENKKVLAIVGTANLRLALEDQLEYRDKVRYFGYEEDPMCTSRESQLIQQFLQAHGHLPEGIGDLDDLF